MRKIFLFYDIIIHRTVVVEAKKQDSVLYELYLSKQNIILSIASNLISLVPTLTSPHS